jgi:hypothetical protein
VPAMWNRFEFAKDQGVLHQRVIEEQNIFRKI